MIRKYRQQDEETVIRIWLEASVIAHHFIPRSYWESKVEDMRKIYLPQSETYLYTDSDTGEIIGFISLSNDYLAALFIAPNRQGQGIGQALITHAKKLKTRLELNVYQENTQAVSFYKRQGFQTSHEQIDKATGHKEFNLIFQNKKNGETN